MNKFRAGFTLVELMVVLSIVAVLAVIAIPDLRVFLHRSQRQQVVSDVVSGLAITRSEAIKRGVPVTLAATTAGSEKLQLGWQIFVDPNRTATFDSASGSLTTLIAAQDPYPNNEVLIGRRGTGATTTSVGNEYFHFDSLGRATTITGASGASGLTVAVTRASVDMLKSALCVSWGGRVRVVEGLANNDTGGCG